MVTQLTLKEVLGKAVQKEIESQHLYRNLSQKMTEEAAKDVFLLAANREKASHEFYLSLAQIHPTGKVKRLIEGLAAQELEYKQRVEFLYTEVAFPQTNGG